MDHEHPAWSALLREYVNAEPEAAGVLREKGRRPGFLAYDWSLNSR